MFLNNFIYFLLIAAVSTALKAAEVQKYFEATETIDFDIPINKLSVEVKCGLKDQLNTHHEKLMAEVLKSIKDEVSILKQAIIQIQIDNLTKIQEIFQKQFTDFKSDLPKLITNVSKTILQEENQSRFDKLTTTVQMKNQVSSTETTNFLKCDPLRFHPNAHYARVTNNGRTVEKTNDKRVFGIALTSRQLHSNELFEVRLERLDNKWIHGTQIGVTVHSAEQFHFLSDMKKEITGTWVMIRHQIYHNGVRIKDFYGTDLIDLTVDDRVGVMRKDDGNLHFFVNGEDMGVAVTGVPEHVYGFVELWDYEDQASIMDTSECQSIS